MNFDEACLFYLLIRQTLLTLTLPLPSQTSLSNMHLCETNVYNEVISLKHNKAVGIDGIGPSMLKLCIPLLVKPLHYLLTLSIRQCICLLPSDPQCQPCAAQVWH